jgi:hypothetical protein
MYPYQTYNGAYSQYGNYPGYSPYSNRYYNSPYTSQPISSAVKVMQSAVVEFRPDGKLEWDHSLTVENDDHSALEQASDFWVDKNSIMIVNKTESELQSKVRFKNNESVSDTIKVMLKNPGDVVRDESNDEGGVRLWYNKTFYLWGYQTLKDPTAESASRVRDVFYIIKVDAN